MLTRLVDICLPNVECFFYGCSGNSSGHYFHGAGKSHEFLRDAEWTAQRALGGLTRCGKPTLDGSLCWNSTVLNPPPAAAKGLSYKFEIPPRQERGYQRDETEGRAFKTCRNGWTAVAFWDRTGDKRGASNTVFLARGDLTFSQLVRAAKHAWPEVWARFTFPVIEVDEHGREIG